MTSESMGLAAADYVVAELSVLPCEPYGKRPLWGLSWEDASSDPEKVMEWWGMVPTANVGVACIGLLVVLDLDGPAGEAAIARLEAEHGLLPVTREVITGRGRHLYWRRPEGLTEGWRWLEGGLELKANGYVLAPPSIHPTGAIYTDAELLEPDAELPELPPWLVSSPRPVEPPPSAPLPPPTGQDTTRLQAAARAALEGELEKMQAHGSERGSARHTRLYAAAAALGHHVAAGGIDRSEVEGALWEGAQRLLGLPADAETWHQVNHGVEDGLDEPYVLRDRPQLQAPATNGNGSEPPPVIGPAPTTSVRRREFAAMTPQLLDWLWGSRVPLGKLTVLAGLPGQGKSLLTCWLAAWASKGLLDADPMDVLMVSAEDDPEDTILPRLLRCGADLARVSFLDVRDTAEGQGYYRSVALPSDTRRILETWKGGLLILDPIGGLLDADHDGYKAQHVRAALGPLKQAAEERRSAVVLIQHLLTKAQTTDPLAKLADSHAYAALPRSVLLFGPDPEDEQDERGASKVLLLAKSNVAGRGEHGLRFTITEPELVGWNGGLGYSAGIQLDGPTEATAADSLAGGEERSALREAQDWLRGELADGPQQAGAMIAAAEAAGISNKTLRRAREKVCKRPYKNGPGPWYWELRPIEGGHLGHDGHLPQPRRDKEGAQGDQGAHVVLQLYPDRDEDTLTDPDGSV